MDFIDALRVLGRRWRVLVVGIALIMAAGLAGVFLVPTNYQASGQLVLLLGPRSGSSRSPTNPYLNLEPGLTVTASIIASTLTTKGAQRSVEQAGFTSDYAVAVNPGTGPLLEVSAEDTDPIMAVKTRDEVIRRLRGELLRMQSEVGAPSRQLINVSINSAPQQADPLPGSKIRALAVIGGVGIFLTLIVAFSRDRSMRQGSAMSANPASAASAEAESPARLHDESVPVAATLRDELPAPTTEGVAAQLHEDSPRRAQAQESEKPPIRGTDVPEEESTVDSGWPRPSWISVNRNGLVDEQQEQFRNQQAHNNAADDLAG